MPFLPERVPLRRQRFPVGRKPAYRREWEEWRRQQSKRRMPGDPEEEKPERVREDVGRAEERVARRAKQAERQAALEQAVIREKQEREAKAAEREAKKARKKAAKNLKKFIELSMGKTLTDKHGFSYIMDTPQELIEELNRLGQPPTPEDLEVIYKANWPGRVPRKVKRVTPAVAYERARKGIRAPIEQPVGLTGVVETGPRVSPEVWKERGIREKLPKHLERVPEEPLTLEEIPEGFEVDRLDEFGRPERIVRIEEPEVEPKPLTEAEIPRGWEVGTKDRYGQIRTLRKIPETKIEKAKDIMWPLIEIYLRRDPEIRTPEQFIMARIDEGHRITPAQEVAINRYFEKREGEGEHPFVGAPPVTPEDIETLQRELLEEFTPEQEEKIRITMGRYPGRSREEVIRVLREIGEI